MIQTPILYSVARRVAGMHGKILLTETLIALTNDQECLTLESVHMERIERFVVFMYNKTCACSKVMMPAIIYYSLAVSH